MSMRRDSDETVQEPLLGSTSPERGAVAGWGGVAAGAGGGTGTGYARLASEPAPLEHEHEARLLALGSSVGSLRTLSKQIGSELDEQAVYVTADNTRYVQRQSFI